jgi:hypothetical protein
MRFPPFLILLLTTTLLFAQEEQKPFSLEVDYTYGSILEHNPDISHLIAEHPRGFTLAYNRKTYGFSEWERRYQYPDWGFTFIYQDQVNPILGENYSVVAHMNWYFYNRNLVIRVGQGIGLATNPFDEIDNPENNAYGTRLLSNTFLKANYVRENVWKGLGIHAGFSIVHYSNANIHAPNNSTNTFAFNAGVSYQLDAENFPDYIPMSGDELDYKEKIKYNVAFRMGSNESDYVNQGAFPFYVFSGFASKRINYKSSFTAGVDMFFATFLKEQIKFESIAYPELGTTGDEDYKRVGVFIGHELRFNKVAFVSQLGYYVYWPYEFENRIYNRLGLQRYFMNDKFFAAITLKAHGAKAEGAEFGIGYRL